MLLWMWMRTSLSQVWLFVTTWGVACQAPWSTGFPRQEYYKKNKQTKKEYCSGLPFPFPGELPGLRINPRSLSLQPDSLLSEPPGKGFVTWIIPLKGPISKYSHTVRCWELDFNIWIWRGRERQNSAHNKDIILYYIIYIYVYIYDIYYKLMCAKKSFKIKMMWTISLENTYSESQKEIENLNSL